MARLDCCLESRVRQEVLWGTGGEGEGRDLPAQASPRVVMFRGGWEAGRRTGRLSGRT